MHENDVLCYVKLILMMYYGIVILLYSRLKQFEIQEIKSLNFMTDFLKIFTAWTFMDIDIGNMLKKATTWKNNRNAQALS